MLTDWYHWISSAALDQLFWMVAPILLLDVTRYALGGLVMCVYDFCKEIYDVLLGRPEPTQYEHCPSVCVVLAGLNEGDTIGHCIASLCGSYPRLEIIVSDDGSTDGMAQIAAEYARKYPGVTVLKKPQRGGKSSALNFALPFTQAEILVCVDTDSHLGPNAIWEIVQPFTNPQVAAVSGTVMGRNPYVNLLTWLQALEYWRVILVGRMFSSRLNILGIVSGAFGAFRRSTVERAAGWDVGPGEDGDLVLRLRKAGYRIVAAPYAMCFTNLPTNAIRLFKQRRRWEWAVITFECRKHIDLANPFAANFRFSNLILVLERWFYNVFSVYLTWIYMAWLFLFQFHDELGYMFFTFYLMYLMIECVQIGVALFYSDNRLRDAPLALVAPLLPFYYLYLKAASAVALTEELLWRRSFRDNFVPERVRDATWHW